MSPMDKTTKSDQSTQPAGVPAHGMRRGGTTADGSDQALLDLHARLSELVPVAEDRAVLLRIPVSVEAAWSEGRMLPVLRAQRKPMEAHIARIELERRYADRG